MDIKVYWLSIEVFSMPYGMSGGMEVCPDVRGRTGEVIEGLESCH